MSTILPAVGDVPALVPSPGSTTWRIAGDARLLAGAGYALLLQVSHPVVGVGVAQHSDYRSDPWGRLWRTLDYVNLTIFGGPQAAADAGRRTREMHRAIKGVRPDGERYHALEPEAFAWVHATLAHSILRSHDAFGLRPAPAERARFYAEWRRLGRLIGVRERDLPEDFGAFEAYVAATVRDVLRDNPTVHGVLATLADPQPPLPRVPGPAWRALRAPATHGMRLATTGLLEPELRRCFGLPWSRADKVQFAALGATARASGPVLPRPLRDFGRTYLRLRRLA